MEKVITSNDEAIEAWNGVLFDRFVAFRDLIIGGFGRHSDEAMRLVPPKPGDRVLDIGCGFGDTTRQLAELAGSQGSAHGVDAAERFIETARSEAEEAGIDNVSFEVADVEGTTFEDSYDYAFSRFGTMFFANPVAAMRNVREALVPGGRLCMVVWRQKIDNPWMYNAEQAVERFVEEPEESDEPTCGPGPFSMANADTTSGVLLSAGFEDVSLRRCDLPFKFPEGLEQALDLVMALGPAGEILRLAAEEADKIRPKIADAIRESLREFDGPDGFSAPTSTWIVTATAPAV
jgi:SAM-dependent methyltransferase